MVRWGSTPFRHRMPANRSTVAPPVLGSSSSPRPSNSAPSAKLHTQPTPPYPCRACAKVFSKVKSRNAHMKTHRHEDTSP
nr:zinc finger protein 541-like isoform X2 [Oncorhynchus nerka]